MFDGVSIIRAIWIWFEKCGKEAKCKVPKCGKRYSLKGGIRCYRLMTYHVFDHHYEHDFVIDSVHPPSDETHAKAIKVFETEALKAQKFYKL